MEAARTPRIGGVDVARGIAVLGMFTAHIGNDADLQVGDASSLLEAFDGRSAAGFALLAGVSAALLSGGRTPFTGARLRHARVRILVRAVLLAPLGLAVEALDTPVIVILPTYAILFAVMAGVVHLRVRTLLAAAAAVLVVAPPVVVLARDAFGAQGPPAPLDLVIGHFYPAAGWIAYLLVGLAVGRLDLRETAVRWRLVAVGAAVAVAGHLVNAVAMRAIDESHTLRRALLTTLPHSSSGVEIAANSGVVLAVLGLCLMVADRFPRTVGPVAATGALALTAYCGHLVAIAVIGPEVVRRPDNVTLLMFIGVTLAATLLWRAILGRGPLERLLHLASKAAADAVVPDGRAPSPGADTPGRTGSEPAGPDPR